MTIPESSTPASQGPPPVVCYGQVLHHKDHPGVQFVMPYNAEAVGGAQSSLGWTIPLVLVTADLSVEQVMAAAVQVGKIFGVTGQMRAAVKAWSKSVDRRQNPHQCPSEWVA